MKKRIGVGIIGCGFVTNSFHLPAWRNIHEATIVAVCDSNSQKAQETMHRWNIPHSYTAVADMLKNSDISLVDVCTPVTSHFNLVVQGIEAGRHILSEKPFVSCKREAESIDNLLRKHPEVRICIVHNWLYDPNISRLRTYMEQGKLGDIVSAQVEGFYGGDKWASEKENYLHKMPGGRLGETLAHQIYVLRALLGNLKVEKVLPGKFGDYPWMKYDEVDVLFSAGRKLGRCRLSMNAPTGLFIRVCGTKASYSLIGSHTLIKYPMPPGNGFGGPKYASALAVSAVTSWSYCLLEAIRGHWSPGTQKAIQAFVDSISNGSTSPVTMVDAINEAELFDKIAEELA